MTGGGDSASVEVVLVPMKTGTSRDNKTVGRTKTWNDVDQHSEHYDYYHYHHSLQWMPFSQGVDNNSSNNSSR